jgi:hypothetical protein
LVNSVEITNYLYDCNIHVQLQGTNKLVTFLRDSKKLVKQNFGSGKYHFKHLKRVNPEIWLTLSEYPLNVVLLRGEIEAKFQDFKLSGVTNVMRPV